MQFTKMHGLGNDYVYVNCFEEKNLPDDLPELARRVSDRHFGIGSDGLILVRPSEVGDARMQMFNADGSEAEMCGNGVRCVAKLVYDHGICRNETLRIETGAGLLSIDLEIVDGRVAQATVDMGEPILTGPEIPTTLQGDPVCDVPLEVDGQTLRVTCVSMGNPHCVTFVDKITDNHIHGLGPKVENHAAFPNRINAEFVEVLSPTEMNMRVWERGSGETLACG
ncbi:MAG: diaminopimelate epimerase, partial [Planctomycetia bacterium]